MVFIVKSMRPYVTLLCRHSQNELSDCIMLIKYKKKKKKRYLVTFCEYICICICM